MKKWLAKIRQMFDLGKGEGNGGCSKFFPVASGFGREMDEIGRAAGIGPQSVDSDGLSPVASEFALGDD